MNFIELRVEEYIDEVLDTETNQQPAEIQALRKFVQYLDRETEVYSTQDLSKDVALDFLRVLRNPKEREVAISGLNGFLAFLHRKGHVDRKLELDAGELFRVKLPEKGTEPPDFFEEDVENAPRHRPRRAFD